MKKRGRPTTHGRTKDPMFSAWMMMRQRCNNPNAQGYERYGGRGIGYDPRWDDFASFLEDMGERPSPKHSLNRIDNDGDYTPENCEWATYKAQTKNTTSNVMVTIGDKTLCVSDWAEVYGIRRVTVYARILRGWDEVRAITTPVDYGYLLK